MPTLGESILALASGEEEVERNPLEQTSLGERILYGSGATGDYDQRTFNHMLGMEAARREVAGQDEAIGPRITRNLWFVGSGFQAGNNAQVVQAQRRIREGQSRPQDYVRLAEHERLQEIASERTTGEQIGEVASSLPGFAVEFAATGGAYSGVNAAVRGAAPGLVRRGAAMAAGAAAQTALNPGRILEATTRRQIDQEGVEPRTFWQAAGPGAIDAFTETFTERLGGTAAFQAMGRAPGAVLSRIGMGRATGFISTGMSNRLAAIGIHSPISEILEERAGEGIRGAVLGRLMGERDDFGASGQLAQGDVGGFMHQMFVEGAAFSIFSGGAHGLGAVMQAREGTPEHRLRQQVTQQVDQLEQTFGPWEQGGRERYQAFEAQQRLLHPPQGLPGPHQPGQDTPAQAPTAQDSTGGQDVASEAPDALALVQESPVGGPAASPQWVNTGTKFESSEAGDTFTARSGARYGVETTQTIQPGQDTRYPHGMARIVASDSKGQEIGKVVFTGRPDGKWFGTVIVEKSGQRTGVASALYDFAEQRLGDIVPDENRSEAGKALWEGNARRARYKKTDINAAPNVAPAKPAAQPSQTTKPAKPTLAQIGERHKAGEPVSVSEVFEAGGLTPQEQNIVQERLTGRSYTEIGKDLGLTRQRIQQLEKGALGKLGAKGSLAQAVHDVEKTDRALDKVAQGRTVSANELHHNPDVVRQVVKKKLSKLEQQQEDIEALTTQLLEEAERGELTEARIAEIGAEAQEVLGQRPERPEAEDRPAPQVRAKPAPRSELEANVGIIPQADLIPERYANRQEMIENLGKVFVLRHVRAKVKPTASRLDEIAERMVNDGFLRPGNQNADDALLSQLEDLNRRGPQESAETEETQMQSQFEEEQAEAATEQQAESAAIATAPAQVSPEFLAQFDAFFRDEAGTLKIPAALVDFFRVRPGATPGVVVSQERVPRFQSQAEERQTATAPQGLGRVPGLARLVDPRARADQPVDQAVITRQYQVEKGKSYAALEAQRQTALYTELWPVNKQDGTMALTNGTRGFMADVIEDEMAKPGSQKISQAQRDWINNEWIPILRSALEQRRAEGITVLHREDGSSMSIKEALDQGYFPRPAIGKRNLDVTARGTGAKPGGKTTQQRRRAFETEEQGATGIRPDGTQGEEIVIYDPSFSSRIAKFLAGEYRSVADNRLATDPNLGGKTADQRYAEIAAREADRLQGAAPSTRIDIMREWQARSMQPLWGKEESVYGIPAFKDLFFPKDTVDALQKMYGREGSQFFEFWGKMTSISKGAVLSVDFGLPLVQGLPVLFSRPTAWAKATANMFRAFATSKPVMARWLQRPDVAPLAQELVQSGASISRLHDNLAGLEEGNLLTRIPLAGRLYGAFGRAATAFFDTAKIEMWRSYRIRPKEQWPQAAEAIENLLGQGRMESIGITPGAALAERTIFNAPMYYRGVLGSIASMFQQGVQGEIARRGILGMAAGVTLVSVGGMLAFGLDWEEIKKRLNPTNGRFLRVPMPLPDGTRAEVGFGHLFLSLTKLAAQTTTWGNRAIDTGSAGNPFVRFFQSHSALAPGLMMDLATGKDFLGNRQTTTEATARRFIPLAAQQAAFGEGSKTQNANDALFSFFGMSSFGQDERSAFQARINQRSQDRFNQPYSQLTFQQARQLSRLLEREGVRPPPATSRQVERAMANAEMRRETLMQGIDRENRNRLLEFAHRLPSYDRRISDTPLTDEWAQRYERLLIEEYNRTVSRWNMERLRNARPAAREELIVRQLREAKERAQRRFMQASR